LVEQRPFKAWVLGSNPSELTIENKRDILSVHNNENRHSDPKVMHKICRREHLFKVELGHELPAPVKAGGAFRWHLPSTADFANTALLDSEHVHMRKRFQGSVTVSTRGGFWMIGASQPQQLGTGDQNPRTDPSHLELLICRQVIQGPQTDGLAD
jgi:hypothetical protein